MPDTTEAPTKGIPPASDATRLDRRAVFGTVLGGIGGIAVLSRKWSLPGSGGSEPSLQSVAQDPGTPVSTTFEESVATAPAATPVPSPGATPAEMRGELQVHRGDSFEYESEPVDGGTLALPVAGGAENLNFNPASFRQDLQITASYLDPLVWVDNVTMEPVPWLAERWEWSDDSREVIFYLRDDVRWHDGDLLDARDVEFSFLVYRDDIDSGVRNLFTLMESAEAIDDHTLRIRLFSPDGNWVRNASSQFIFQRKQYVAHWSAQPEGQRTLSDFDWASATPVGTGPWSIGRRRSVRIECERNDNYWAGPPNFEGLHLIISGGREERLQRWQAGELDVLWPAYADDIESLSNRSATLYASGSATVMFAAFNFQNLTRALPGLLEDIRIRRAFSLAIDRERIGAEIFDSFSQAFAAGTVAQPWAHDSTTASPRRDIDAARTLLEEAGLTDLNGDGWLEDYNGGPLAFSAIVRDDANPLLIRLLEELTGDFAEIGVQFQLRVLAPDDFTNSWTTLRDYDLIAYSYALYPGFTDWDLYGSNWDIRINPQGWNPGGYHNEDVDGYITRIQLTTNPERQREMLIRLQQTVDEDLFGLWFGFPDDLVVTRSDIRGFQPNKYLPTWNTRMLWREPT